MVFLDARRIPKGADINSECCIIGGGVAGITIALELHRAGVQTCLLESGALRRERQTQNLYAGENISQIFDDDGGSFKHYLRISRSRYLGGSSNCWGGWCRPFDDLDFKKRAWIPNNHGWPFSKADFEPFYMRAHDVLKLGPFKYDPTFWQDAVGSPAFRVLPLTDSVLHTLISQFSKPLRMGHAYYDEMAQSPTMKALLRANVVEIEVNDDRSRVTRVHVATLSGNRFSVSARYFVLATGGIENARLLLASNRQQSNGLGNGYDLVGRYFMEHLVVPTGRITFARRDPGRRVYDSLYCYNNPTLMAHNICVAAHLGITEKEQERHRLLNSRTFFRSILKGDESAGVESLRNLYRLLRNTHKFPAFRPADVFNVLTGVGGIARVAAGRLFGAESLEVEHRLLQVVEPSPNPDSRVMLGRERDRLGLPKVVLDWRMGELERRTMIKVRELIGAEFERHGIGHIDPWPLGERWPSKAQWVWHHMGTTRMDDDPKRGVVDRHGQVHGIHNLFAAGSSVFPSCSADAPTLTITAMALRLADHLRDRLTARSETTLLRRSAAATPLEGYSATLVGP
jgi:choline dehydrogenase-like flavoprotein